MTDPMRVVRVPHERNGEWARVAEVLGDTTVRIEPGRGAQDARLDPAAQESSLTDQEDV
jgi:hypothetical protein